MYKLTFYKKMHIIIGGAIGNFTEWYNFLLYGYLASVVSQLFFPFHEKMLALTLTFTIFAVSFFMRPLGGILFGWIGDTYGRQRALIISSLMMAVPTLLIGCLPIYDKIGVASPILLCFFRLIQGLSAGGEHTGSAVYLAEYAPSHRRTLWVSIVPVTAAAGILTSSIASLWVVNSFTSEQLLSWGWRTAFWAGSLLCFVSLLLRITLPETPAFKNKREKKAGSLFSVFHEVKDKNVRKDLFFVFFLAGAFGVFYQILFVWMPTYLTYIHHFSHSATLKLNSIFMLLFVFLLLLVGYCSDYISRKLLLIFSCIVMFIAAIPLFRALSFESLHSVYYAMGIFTLIFSLFVPTSFVCMVESFSSQIRYTGLSLGFNMGLALFGGTSPLIATWLIEVTGNLIAPAFYMMLFAVIGLFTAIYIQDKKGQSIVNVSSV